MISILQILYPLLFIAVFFWVLQVETKVNSLKRQHISLIENLLKGARITNDAIVFLDIEVTSLRLELESIKQRLEKLEENS